MMLDRAALYAEIDRHFLTPENLSRILLFSHDGRQVEGWFKGELLYLFHALEDAGQIGQWASEVRVTPGAGKRFDFKLLLEDGPLYLEVKILFHGLQSGQRIDLGIYFSRIADGVGITGDVKKLMGAPDGNKGLLLFVHPRPIAEKWAKVLAGYARVAPIAFREDSNVSVYPEAMYICKLSLQEGS